VHDLLHELIRGKAAHRHGETYTAITASPLIGRDGPAMAGCS